MPTAPRYARLNKDDLNKVQSLEKEIGKIVLAYEPNRESPYAELSSEQVQRIKQLESELGIVLLAYKPNTNK